MLVSKEGLLTREVSGANEAALPPNCIGAHPSTQRFESISGSKSKLLMSEDHCAFGSLTSRKMTLPDENYPLLRDASTRTWHGAQARTLTCTLNTAGACSAISLSSMTAASRFASVDSLGSHHDNARLTCNAHYASQRMAQPKSKLARHRSSSSTSSILCTEAANMPNP